MTGAAVWQISSDPTTVSGHDATGWKCSSTPQREDILCSSSVQDIVLVMGLELDENTVYESTHQVCIYRPLVCSELCVAVKSCVLFVPGVALCGVDWADQ